MLLACHTALSFHPYYLIGVLGCQVQIPPCQNNGNALSPRSHGGQVQQGQVQWAKSQVQTQSWAKYSRPTLNWELSRTTTRSTSIHSRLHMGIPRYNPAVGAG